MSAEKRQQAFEAWLEKKKEEQREKRAKAMAARQQEMEQRTIRMSFSRQAYQRWTREKEEKDAIARKQKQKEKELELLKAEERREQGQRARESYLRWKSVKDETLKLQVPDAAEEPLWLSPLPSRGCTPPLPGYCSVWSCDGNVANYMLQRVKRNPSRSV